MQENFNKSVFDYDVTFLSVQDNVLLSGTLSVPASSKSPPVVILISGVGPYDRDCTQSGDHKMFLIMAQYFTQRGVAVLRYDKRGIGKSGGNFNTASTFDFAQDVFAALQFLKQRTDIDTHRIGLVGHSEGGLISFIVASQSSDVAFVVSMAGAVITTVEDLLEQARLQFKSCGATDDFIIFDRIIRKQILEAITTLSVEDAQKRLLPLVKSYLMGMTDEQKNLAETLLPFALIESNYEQWIFIFNHIWRAIIKSNPLSFIAKVTVPVLAINGGLDFIIPARLALPIIKKGLADSGNQQMTVLEIPNQNHCFQRCKTGSLSEYVTIKEAVCPSTLKLIAEWILAIAAI